jgi:hypothetical protein
VCDWAARLLGLDNVFQNESGKGGGVIQVRRCAGPVVYAN